MPKLTTDNEIEAAHRAEVTALLIWKGYRVYRPEADCDGEDMVLRFPAESDKKLFPNEQPFPCGELRAVQLKSRPTVDKKYTNYSDLWMLFPDPKKSHASGREWFLVPHKDLYEWMEKGHGHTTSMKLKGGWSAGGINKGLRQFLSNYVVINSSP